MFPDLPNDAIAFETEEYLDKGAENMLNMVILRAFFIKRISTSV